MEIIGQLIGYKLQKLLLRFAHYMPTVIITSLPTMGLYKLSLPWNCQYMQLYIQLCGFRKWKKKLSDWNVLVQTVWWSVHLFSLLGCFSSNLQVILRPVLNHCKNYPLPQAAWSWWSQVIFSKFWWLIKICRYSFYVLHTDF